jgi:3-hydroxybutyrate dehydrogenase
MRMERYDLMQRLMVRAPFYLSKLVISHMRRSGDGTGVIGNMASIYDHICTVNKPVYNIAEFGFSRFSKCLVGGNLMFDGGVALKW